MNKELEGHNIWRMILAMFASVPIANAGFPQETSQKWETGVAWAVSYLAIQFLVNFPLERIENRLRRLEDEAKKEVEKH